MHILKFTILELPRKYPSNTKVIGVNLSQAKEQIPILCSNIDDAISALKKGKDKYNRTITNHEMAYGLNNLMNTITGNPGSNVFISSVLDRSGIIELERKIDELKKIAENIRNVIIDLDPPTKKNFKKFRRNHWQTHSTDGKN